jgi:hypothetical protein
VRFGCTFNVILMFSSHISYMFFFIKIDIYIYIYHICDQKTKKIAKQPRVNAQVYFSNVLVSERMYTRVYYWWNELTSSGLSWLTRCAPWRSTILAAGKSLSTSLLAWHICAIISDLYLKNQKAWKGMRIMATKHKKGRQY